MEVAFEALPLNVVQDLADARGHCRLLDLGLAQQRHGRLPDLRQLAGDRVRDPLVFVGEETDQGFDLSGRNRQHGAGTLTEGRSAFKNMSPS